MKIKPSTDGEKITMFSYMDSPYLTSDKEESSAVLKVKSKPRSVTDSKSTFYRMLIVIGIKKPMV